MEGVAHNVLEGAQGGLHVILNDVEATPAHVHALLHVLKSRGRSGGLRRRPASPPAACLRRKVCRLRARRSGATRGPRHCRRSATLRRAHR